MVKAYSDDFFENRPGALLSARHIVPIALSLIHPESVVDVGCGTGDFLSVFYEKGVKDILGIDGKWVDMKKLRISNRFFRSADLEKPLEIDRKFDLVVSLEVAEHLNESSANTFISSLTGLGPVILFSAAIPFQGGVHHVNEQWPKYWVELFDQQGYVVIDCLRKKLWDNPEVSFWYAQNTFLFVSRDSLKKYPKLYGEWEQLKGSFLSLVHPGLYLPRVKSLDRLMRLIPFHVRRLVTQIKKTLH